jgi:hypothetical protein
MAIPNGLDPALQSVKLPGNVIITGGTGTSAAIISGLIGTSVAANGAGFGSIYICNSGATPVVWVNLAGTWTGLTIN